MTQKQIPDPEPEPAYGGAQSSARQIPMLAIWLTAAYLATFPLAELLIRRDFEITRDRSWFAVVNAATLTGFSYSVAVEAFTPLGQATVLGLTLAGALFSMIVGGMAVVRILRLPYTDGQIVRSALFSIVVLAGMGTIALAGSGQDPFEAAMLSASSLANSGLSVGTLPGIYDWRTHLVLLPLMVMGGLGLPVLMEIADALLRRRVISQHTRTVLVMTAGLYIGVTLLCALVQWLDGSSGPGLMGLLGSSSVVAINSRTGGLPFAYVRSFPRGMQWVLMLAMFIGGSPGGTAGGLKTTTLVTLVRGVHQSLRGKHTGRAYGLASTWLGIYLLTAVLSLLLLLATEPQLSPDRLLFETISALSNVGLSHDVILVVGPGLVILTATMLLGRLLPLGILWWMAQTTEEAELAIA